MEWFKFYTAWGEGIQELSDAEAGRFIKALCASAESEETPSLSGAEKVLYAIASRQLKQDADHAARISSVRAEAGRGRGLNSKQMQANANNCLQMLTNAANADKCSNKNKELRIKNSEEEKEIDKEKDAKPQKHKHGNFKHVFLTDDEFLRLQTDFQDWQKRIQKLDDYLENNPSKHYANHNLTIRKWAEGDAEKAKQKQAQQPKPVNEYPDIYTRMKAEGII